MGMTDEDIMPFSTDHKGKRMIDVPASFLLWFFEKGNGYPKVKAYIRENLDVITKQAKEESSKPLKRDAKVYGDINSSNYKPSNSEDYDKYFRNKNR